LNRHGPKPVHASTAPRLCSGWSPRRAAGPLAAQLECLRWLASGCGLPREAQPPRWLAPGHGLPREAQHARSRREGLTSAQAVAALENDSRLKTRSHLPRETRSASDATTGANLDSRISVAAPKLPSELRVRQPPPEGGGSTHPGATTGVTPAHEVAVSELPPTPGSAPHPPERGAARIRTTTGVTLALGVAAAEFRPLHRAVPLPPERDRSPGSSATTGVIPHTA